MRTMGRVFHIFQLLQEAESDFSRIPQRMVRLVFTCPVLVMPTVEDLRRWLIDHGMGRYEERIIEVPGSSGVFVSQGTRIPLRQYYIIFPRRNFEDVRYLGHVLPLFLSEEDHMYAEYLHLTSRYPHLEFYLHDPRSPLSRGSSLSLDREQRFWNSEFPKRRGRRS